MVWILSICFNFKRIILENILKNIHWYEKPNLKAATHNEASNYLFSEFLIIVGHGNFWTFRNRKLYYNGNKAWHLPRKQLPSSQVSRFFAGIVHGQELMFIINYTWPESGIKLPNLSQESVKFLLPVTFSGSVWPF